MLTLHPLFLSLLLLKLCVPLEAAPVFQELCSAPHSEHFTVRIYVHFGQLKTSLGFSVQYGDVANIFISCTLMVLAG